MSFKYPLYDLIYCSKFYETNNYAISITKNISENNKVFLLFQTSKAKRGSKY